MKLRLIALLGVGLLASQVIAQEASDLKTQKDKESYSIGVAMARNLKRQGFEVEPEDLVHRS